MIALMTGAVACSPPQGNAAVPDRRVVPGAVDAARLEASAPDAGQWMSTGRTYDEQRFSPLTAITAKTVSKLGLAGSYDIPTSMGQEATPIVVDGVMYVSTDWSIVKALDARNGTLKWTYDPHAQTALVKACCGPVNRGVAVWKGKVFVGTLDGRLVALDAATGKVVWETLTVDRSKPYTITGAPRVIRGRVLIGNGGADMGVRGYVSAYDAETGKLDWRFYTVPGPPGRPDGAASDKMMATHAGATWAGDYWKLGGGGTVWDSMAYDPKLDLLYIGTGNGGPWNHAIRSAGKGDNLFLSSIVALRPATGEYVWHYQTTPADSWDFTATQHMILADLTIGGRVRQVIMQAPKNGFFYVIDRATGELLAANAIVPMTWASGVDLKTGRPIENPGARYYRSGKSFLMAPSALGAHNWQPMSFSPITGLVYIPVQQLPVGYADDRKQKFTAEKANTGAAYDLMPASERLTPKGWLAAWNPVTGKEVWRVARPVPTNGGVLSTAGGVVFQGDAQGIFAAYTTDTGHKLWSFDVQTGIVAAPITYSVNGEQYVAVMAGWGGSLAMVGGSRAGAVGENRLLIFKLGGAGTLPKAITPSMPPLDPPVARQPQWQVVSGGADYFSYCSRCHGTAAISGGIVPDLRHTALLKDDGWYSVLIDGALTQNGMVSFAPVLSRDRITAIRSYVISEAQKAQATERAPGAARVFRPGL